MFANPNAIHAPYKPGECWVFEIEFGAWVKWSLGI